MLNSEKLDNIKMLITPILEEEKLCLFDISFCWQAGRWFLRLLIDKIYGGITLDECSKLNEKIGALIEKEGIIKQGYILEVSSPGIGRPLLTLQDFSRCLNRKVRIFFNQCLDQKYEISGIITSVTEAGLNLDLGEKIYHVSFDQIKKGIQVVEVK